MPQIYQTALGICTGDLVTRKNHPTTMREAGKEPYLVETVSGPYRVWSMTTPECWYISNLALCIWPYPVINLRLVPPTYTKAHEPRSGFAYFNDVHRMGDRWWNVAGEEILVEKATPSPLQMSFLRQSEAEPAPYPFQPKVDYTQKDAIWHCRECGTDFNGQTSGGHKPFHCGRLPLPIYRMGDGDLRCEYQRYLGMPVRDAMGGDK